MAIFTEYRELIDQLKATDPHFCQLCSKHSDLDHTITQMDAHRGSASHEDIEILKKKKLLLKDEIYELLKRASSTEQTSDM